MYYALLLHFIYGKKQEQQSIVVEQNISADIVENNVTTDSNKEKGNQFEEYIIDFLLAEKEMQLLSKVSDYYKDGRFAKDNQTPDLKFKYKDKNFAVECKYRQSFNNNNRITWAEDYQIKNYNSFETESKSKVFIAIGIGGSANNPETVYFVPLYRLTKTFATADYIKEFKVSDAKMFLKILNN